MRAQGDGNNCALFGNMHCSKTTEMDGDEKDEMMSWCELMRIWMNDDGCGGDEDMMAVSVACARVM